jgi:predicted  nucleic acid-binding Zn-ribbon protein
MSEDFTQKLPKNGNDDKILTAIENLETHVTKIDNRLQSLEKKVDERLHDTRPIWHKVVADIGELQSGQKRIEDGQQAMRKVLDELSVTVHQVNRDQIVLNDSHRRIQLDLLTVTERLQKVICDRNQQNSQT